MSGKLYLVATPIGNLGDISPRALQTLTETDFIAAEDTRVTLKLLNHFDIKKPLVSYYEHNRASSGEKIISRILAGENCALVTDAGMPAVSDPGEDLVRLAAENGVQVTVVPGACSVVSALALSALPTGRFTFEGFLSTAKKAPHKLCATLRDMLEVLGDREISISREITKLHEETLRFTLKKAVDYFETTPPRGEFVLVIKGAEKSEESVSPEEALKVAKAYRDKGLAVKDAAKRASEETGISKKELYSALVKSEEEK